MPRTSWTAAWRPLGSAPLLYEEFVPFDYEVSVIGARSRARRDRRLPAESQLPRRRHPAPDAGTLDGAAACCAAAAASLRRVLEAFHYVGVLTIEFFVRRGRLLANEMAPRVHNSGHWTIEGAVTSQFENHLRAITGLPLGITAARGHSAMINLIGTMPQPRICSPSPGCICTTTARNRVTVASSATAPSWNRAPRVAMHAPRRLLRRLYPQLATQAVVSSRIIWLPPNRPTTMYLDLFNLRELPFRLSPDPEFLYLSKAHARAKAYMESTVWFTDGFVVITGEIGCGKTTLIETFLRELRTTCSWRRSTRPRCPRSNSCSRCWWQFGFKPFRMKKAELLATLKDFLVEQYRPAARSCWWSMRRRT